MSENRQYIVGGRAVAEVRVGVAAIGPDHDNRIPACGGGRRRACEKPVVRTMES